MDKFASELLACLTSTTYGDASPAITRSYTPDGLPHQVTSNGSTWTYGYNRRRLLTTETLAYDLNYVIGHSYDANGHLSAHTYPYYGHVVAYAPNALGQPTQVGSYASAVTHHPNGAVAGYTLGNGIVHSLAQNLRGLPYVHRDAGVLEDHHSYDANANPVYIIDAHEGITTRTLGYDALDRLTTANGLGVWGTASYTYDPLDNLRTSTVGSRNTSHSYDAANRLSQLNTNGSLTGLAYDARGNVTGRGNQGYYFDQGNRLQLANGIASYTYDGHGRRTTVSGTDGVSKTHLYSQAGRLLFGQVRQGMTTWTTRYVHLGAKLIAETTNGATEYSHTDALGSPVARTNTAGQVLSRTRYEAYGKTAAGTEPGANGFTGIGFTGHVNDPDTALVYMQQRYYDPMAGRFLSVDPVTTDANTGDSFNRYVYGNNNPYKYTDPDGRFAFLAPLVYYVLPASIVSAAAWGIINSQGSKPHVAAPSSGQNSGQRPSKTPNTGPPGSTHVNPGSGQERTYGPDGKPAVDVDHDHDHGQGVPHRHDWVDGQRGPGQPVNPPAPSPAPPAPKPAPAPPPAAGTPKPPPPPPPPKPEPTR